MMMEMLLVAMEEVKEQANPQLWKSHVSFRLLALRRPHTSVSRIPPSAHVPRICIL